jgi:hypothetical protein
VPNNVQIVFALTWRSTQNGETLVLCERLKGLFLKGTGIHPFIESKGNGKPGLKLLLAVIKAPFIFVISLWYLFVSFVNALIPIPIVQQLFRRYHNTPFELISRYCDLLGCRALLYLLGFWNISSKNLSFKKSSK